MRPVTLPRTWRAISIKREKSPVVTRTDLPKAKRVVVKVGSSSLTSLAGGIDEEALIGLADVLGELRNRGTEVILVSSGAIAAGLAPLGLDRRPRDLATQQAAASVGQGLLMARYTHAFGAHGVTVSQVLLTVEDLIRRKHYANAHRSLERLLNLGVIPIVNENDAVATQEIRFGDNDRVAALVANLVKAEALLLLSDVDSLYDGPPSEGAKRIPQVHGPEDLDGVKIGTIGRAGVGSGGMVTKVEAATIASASGIPALVTSTPNARAALNGEDVGTWFSVTGNRKPIRLLWLAHLARIQGTLILDDGAARAMQRRRSLLPAGITSVSGDFDSGDPVALATESGEVIAHGLVNYTSFELPRMLGRTTGELAENFGSDYERVVVHADDVVLLRRPYSRNRQTPAAAAASTGAPAGR